MKTTKCLFCDKETSNPNFLIKEVSSLMKLYPLCRKEPF